jgi:hypothetical protein
LEYYNFVKIKAGRLMWVITISMVGWIFLEGCIYLYNKKRGAKKKKVKKKKKSTNKNGSKRVIKSTTDR